MITRGYLYPSPQPGLGVDINEALAAKLLKTGSEKRGLYYPPDRKIDGTFVRP